MIYAISERAGGGPEDYCLTLKEALGDNFGRFVRLPNAAEISGDCVFLQYSGYEYAKRGAPLWLLEMIRRDRHKIGTFGIHFHELFASGYPWSSAFWLSPVQRYIAAELARLSDFWVTNTAESGKWLTRYAQQKPHVVLPIFSNVGEPIVVNAVRENKIVVFGTPSRRAAAYRMAGTKLFDFADKYGLEIIDVGAPIQLPWLQTELKHHGVRQLGRLEAGEVSHLLSASKYGVVSHRSGVLAKSGVFAAYSAHRVCPIVLSKRIQIADGLIPGQSYILNLLADRIDDSEQQRIATVAYQWYQSHTVEVHRATLCEINRNFL